MGTSGTLVILFCVATLIAILVQRVRIPYTVALVVVGLLLGELNLVEPPRLTRELLFTFFLPGLLFEAAFHLDLAALRSVWRSVLVLAVPGVAFSIAITAALALLGSRLGLTDLTLWSAVTFGALVAATDPVAVTALFREIRAPKKLATLVEAESLFNDGTGVVFLTLVVSLATNASGSAWSAIPSFFVIAGGGMLVGIVVGYAITRVIHQVDDPMIEIALTTIAAMGSFVLAERIHLSGVLATVMAGIVCAAKGRETGMTEASRAATETFWLYVGFALNSIVFLLMGIEVHASKLAGEWGAIVVGFASMTAARIALVALLHLGFRRTKEALPVSWSRILAWGGLRGALAMVLALSLPEIAQRDRLIAMTVGAVIASLVIQGMTIGPLIRKVRQVQDSTGPLERNG
jgi:CPA1 family monovalent cation:H+ antiporter